MISVNNPEQQKIIQRVMDAGQEHVLLFWPQLSDDSRQQLLAQIAKIDFQLLQTLNEHFIQNAQGNIVQGKLEPAEFTPIPETPEELEQFQHFRELGERALKSGRVAAFLVAGGQGSRLGFDGPKGLFPFSPIKHKTLFQLYAEKILALSQRYGVVIPWYIMTSETNHEQTTQAFEVHAYFGLQAEDVQFFRQEMIPALSPEGKLFLEEKDRIFTNPNGHGGSLSALFKSGALADMRRRGIDLIFYFQVDNVLVNICDPYFLGLHLHTQAQMSTKIVSKREPEEKMGVLGKINGKLGVIEYSDLSEEDSAARNADGSLKFRAGNLAIHVFDVAFVENLNRGGLKLPWHVAHKKIAYLNEHGVRVIPEEPNGYKFETFVFDALQYAEKTAILEVPREFEFSPVKNARGIDSPATARRDQINVFGGWLEIAGLTVPRDAQNNVVGDIEISPLFALDEAEFLSKIDPNLKFDGTLYLG